jgi:membrane fusion protein (multidrug efflux system)
MILRRQNLRFAHLAFAALLALGSACSAKSSGPGSGGGSPGGGAGAKGAKRARGPRVVVAAHPTPTVWPRTVLLHGTLEASESVELAARVDGPLDEVRADLGDVVAPGAVLARVATADFATRDARAAAELAQAESELARAEQLAASQLAPAQAVEQARTRVAVARAERALTAQKLADTSVRAPFRGTIARRYVSRGAYVRAGTPLFSLVAVDTLRLVLEVPERYARDIHIGDAVRVRDEGAPANAEVTATLTRLSPIVDPARRTFRAEADAPGDAGLRPGMFVTAALALGAPVEAVRVPRSAVFTVLGQERVVRVMGDRATPTDVTRIGEDGADAIVEGVNASDLVVTRSAAGLAPGTAVRIDADGARATPAAAPRGESAEPARR